MVRLEYVLESWKGVRQDTIRAVEDFPRGEIDFRPTPDSMTFGETANHILSAGDGLAGLLLSGDDDFATNFREKLGKHITATPGPDAASLARALGESIERRTAELAAKPAEFYSHIMTRFDGQRVTRLEMLQMIKEHELTHRAQLFMCLRMKGIVPATTRRRMAAQGAKS